jgi:hypothetical protein
MIEFYALMALGSLGYFANRNQMRKRLAATSQKAHGVKAYQASQTSPEPGERPSQDTLYESRYTEEVARIVSEKGRRMSGFRSELADADIDTSFHNNMTPFIRGSVRQPTAANGGLSSRNVESFTGADDPHSKIGKDVEREQAFPAMQNIYGAPAQDLRTHYEAPIRRNNECPIPQQRVGPGVGLGYTAEPSGGHQQLNLSDLVMPKDIDELRSKDNPKTTYEGRVHQGQREIKVAAPLQVEKRRPYTTPTGRTR